MQDIVYKLVPGLYKSKYIIALWQDMWSSPKGVDVKRWSRA